MDRYETFELPGFRLHYGRFEQPDPMQFKVHTHVLPEIFYFCQGSASYRVEGNAYPLHPGDLLIMGMGESHSLQVSPDCPYEWVSIHFLPKILEENGNQRLLEPFEVRPMGRWNRQSGEGISGELVGICLERIFSYGKKQDAQGVMAYFLPLLQEVYSCWQQKKPEEITDSGLASEMLRYIRAHLTELRSIRELETAFDMSKSQLSRVFHQKTGTSIWKYIQVKRLFLARKLLEDGTLPVRAASACGYQEYSAFYRAYCKQFGKTPQQDCRFQTPEE